MVKVGNELIVYAGCGKVKTGWCFITKPRSFFEYIDDHYRLKEYKKAYKETRLIKLSILKLIKMTKLK